MGLAQAIAPAMELAKSQSVSELPARPPPGQRKSTAAYMRWYRAMRRHNLPVIRDKRSAETVRKWRREYQQLYRERIKSNGGKHEKIQRKAD